MPPSVSPDLLAALRGALHPNFVVERPLGAGAMGSVVLARDLTLDRPVAVKVINPELAASRSFRDRFLQEARTVAKLRHHNLVTVHTAGEAGGLLFAVMEYVPGESLRERLEREGRLAPEEAARLLHELAGALAYAHAQGVVHRDIKPENVLLDAETGRALLVDFGVAQALAAGDERTTGPGLVVGSPRYMSPEQAAGESLDGRSDLYTLGIVGYEMLAGAPPFAGAGVRAVIAQQITAAPPPLAERAPGTPAALVAVIERALAKDPAARWPDALAMARALAAAMGDAGTSGESGAGIAAGGAPRATAPLGAASGFRRPRSRLPFVAAALLLAGGGGLAAWWGTRHDGPPAGAATRSFLVAPFAVLSGDPSLGWLREGSVSMLTMDLAQWTDLSVVSYERTLDLLRDAGLDGTAPVSLSQAQALARRGGAWSVVTGQVTASPDSLHVAASLYDVASGDLRRQLQVAAPLDSDPRDLFDALARRLLEIAGAPPITPELARTTTSSLAAYRAYLEGVRALNSWQLERADSLLGAAVAADSTFALAHYKRALARGWSHIPDSTDVRFAEAALRHAGRLGARERELVEGYLAIARGLAALPGDTAAASSYLAAAEERYGALLARDTLDAESWYGLGDAHFHHAQVDGRLAAHWTRALRAFDRTLALDSTFHLAYSHKLLVYQAASTAGSPFVVVGDSVLFFPSDTAARRYGAARIERAREAARRLAVEQGGHWVASDPDASRARVALAEAHAAAGDYARAAQVLREALDRPAAATADMPYRIAAYEMAAGSARALPTLRAALAGQTDSLVGGDPLGRGVALVSAANVAAHAGARRDVERLLDLRASTDPMLPFGDLPTARLVPAWRATLLLAMGVDDAGVRRDVDRAIAAADAAEGEFGKQLRAQLATLPFTAFLQGGDSRDLAVLRRWTGRETSLELRILAALDAGDTTQAQRLASQLAPLDTTASVGASNASLRQFARAEAYLALGDARQALRTYAGIDPRRFSPVTAFSDPRWPLYARSFLVRGQLHEQLGERAEAAAAYERFLELWKDADAAFAPQLRAAREGLARVRRGAVSG